MGKATDRAGARPVRLVVAGDVGARWRQAFRDKVREDVGGPFAPGVVGPEAERIWAQVSGAAIADPMNPFTLAEMQADVEALRRDLPARAESVRQQLAR